MKNQKFLSQSYLVAPDEKSESQVKKRYHLFHSTPLFRTAGSGFRFVPMSIVPTTLRQKSSWVFLGGSVVPICG